MARQRWITNLTDNLRNGQTQTKTKHVKTNLFSLKNYTTSYNEVYT